MSNCLRAWRPYIRDCLFAFGAFAVAGCGSLPEELQKEKDKGETGETQTSANSAGVCVQAVDDQKSKPWIKSTTTGADGKVKTSVVVELNADGAVQTKRHFDSTSAPTWAQTFY